MSDSTPDANKAQSKHRRWYDHDPLLLEVLELLKSFQTEVKTQANVFIQKIEEEVGSDALERFYAASRPTKFGNRWYDQDPVVSKAVELIRIVPPETQRQAALKFLDAMKKQGVNTEALSETVSDSSKTPS